MKIFIFTNIILPIGVSIITSFFIFLFNFLLNRIKINKYWKKFKEEFKTIKQRIFQCCNNSFILTPETKNNQYKISNNCIGTYQSLISKCELAYNNIKKITNYSFCQGKLLDKSQIIIENYERLIYNLKLFLVNKCNGINITFAPEFSIDLKLIIHDIEKAF